MAFFCFPFFSADFPLPKEASGCGHEFCWLCRGPWSEHGSATGGYYACNKYDASAAKKDDLSADQVKTELDEYMFYYHRFMAHRSAMGFAAKQAKECEDKCARLQRRFDIRAPDTKFVQDAVGDLSEQRRVLMWSYCYGYALKREGAQSVKEYQLYEDLQEQVEKHCDALSGLYERPEDHIKDYHQFIEWKADVINRHKVVQKFVERFVEDVGSGLSEDRGLGQ